MNDIAAHGNRRPVVIATILLGVAANFTSVAALGIRGPSLVSGQRLDERWPNLFSMRRRRSYEFLNATNGTGYFGGLSGGSATFTPTEAPTESPKSQAAASSAYGARIINASIQAAAGEMVSVWEEGQEGGHVADAEDAETEANEQQAPPAEGAAAADVAAGTSGVSTDAATGAEVAAAAVVAGNAKVAAAAVAAGNSDVSSDAVGRAIVADPGLQLLQDGEASNRQMQKRRDLLPVTLLKDSLAYRVEQLLGRVS